MDVVDVRGLLGLLLADGNLIPYRAPAGGFIQLTLTAGARESAFLEEKVEEFRRYIPTRAKIVPYRTPPRANGKTTEVLRFRVSTNRLRPIYNMLYPERERRITQSVLDLLGARAAGWLWAEGARPQPDGSTLLSRVGLDREEAVIIAQWLAMLTGAESSVNDEKVRPRLHFMPDAAALIRRSLEPYAPETRRFLFTPEACHVPTPRSPRPGLLPRQRQIDAEGTEGQALDGLAPL